MGRLATALLASMLLVSAHLSAAEIRRSHVDPTRLAMASDPQTIYVRPGNRGLQLFSDTATSDPANLAPSQDEYANAIVVNLAAARYDVTISDDHETTHPYWNRMAELMNSLAWSGQAAIWVADDELMTLYRTEPEIASDITSNITRMMDWRIGAPTIVMDLSEWSPAAQSFVHHLRASGLPVSVGFYLRAARPSLAQRHRWDFVICDEEVIPLHYRGQAAAAWVRSVVGQIPVILSPSDHDFFRDVVWVGAGAAGIWHRPLPPVGTAQNEAAAVQLRASTTFLNRFGGGTLPLKPRPDHPAFIFCLERQRAAWAGLLPAGAPAIDIPAPAQLGGRQVRESWFNPATDQTIIRPLTRLPATLSVQAPDDNLWIYSIMAPRDSAPEGTTITQIQDLPY